MLEPITVYEHERLKIDDRGFKKKHWDLLFALNVLHKEKYFQILPKAVKFKHYVGVLQLGDLTIEILPKIDRQNEETDWQRVLLEMLKKTNQLKTRPIHNAHVRKGKLNLIHLYFQLYLEEIKQLVHKGLIKQYRKETKNVNALKGKLEFAGNIQRNLIHKERFYTTHQVYDQNHLLHQILHYALSIVAQFTKGTPLYNDCKSTEIYFDKIQLRPIGKAELDKLKLTRKSRDYEYALELARLIILNYSPDVAAGKEKMLALLFNMNSLWESYILVKLKEAARESNPDIEVHPQNRKSFWNTNTLAPDIFVEYANERFIIDTKWKIPGKTEGAQNLRQIYTYCRFWKANKGMLLYPGVRNTHSGQFETEEFQQGNEESFKHECKMIFISAVDENGKIDAEIGKKVLKELGLI